MSSFWGFFFVVGRILFPPISTHFTSTRPTLNQTNMARLNYYYLDYLYREIGLTRQDINSVPQLGSADDACAEIADKEYILAQLDDVSFEQLKYAVSCLCDNPAIETRRDAIMYLVWMVALNIKDEIK